MTIAQRAHQFWTWFESARFGLSFMHEVDPDIQETMLMDLYEALQAFHPGLTFAIKVEEDGSAAHLVICDDGSPVARRRSRQLLKDDPCFPGWSFGTTTGNPLQEELPDLTDVLNTCKGVYVDLLAVHAPDEDPRFLIFVYVPLPWERGIRQHIEGLIQLFLGPQRFHTLVHSIVFAPAGDDMPGKCVPIARLQSWASRIQPCHLQMQGAVPLYRDQIEELN